MIAFCIRAFGVLLFILTGFTAAWGAVGCDLNDPDRDVARLFPESTGYKTHYVSIDRKGGEPLLAKVEGVSSAGIKTGMRLKAVWKDQVEGDFLDLDHFEPV